MNQKIFYLLFLLGVGLFSCNAPTELSVPNGANTADIFSRAFIDKIISGQPESAFLDVNTEVLNDNAKEFITNTSLKINGAIPKKYRVVEANYSSTVFTNAEKFINYRLGYEYEFERGNILFTTTIIEKEGKLTVSAFNGVFLPSSLAELTKFTLLDKSARHYIFLIMCILVPLFIVITFIVMLSTKMTIKKKIIWALLILLIAFPKFMINWGDGQFGINFVSIQLLGGGVNKPTLYSPWILSFSIPIFAIVFWIKRKCLQSKEEQSENEPQIIE